jgi:hypothetical protein
VQVATEEANNALPVPAVPVRAGDEYFAALSSGNGGGGGAGKMDQFLNGRFGKRSVSLRGSSTVAGSSGGGGDGGGSSGKSGGGGKGGGGGGGLTESLISPSPTPLRHLNVPQ